jgi:hypothetical protein
VAELIDQAQHHYNLAQERLRAGDLAGFGKELEALKAALDSLSELKDER